MIYEYLERLGAIGKKNLLHTKRLMNDLHAGKREIIAAVADERKAGRLICSTRSGGGGYFLPANDAEIIEQKKSLEITFASRADAVRVFRKACKEIEERKAAGHVKEKGI